MITGTEAYGWAAVYGPAWGLAAAACQEAAAARHAFWAALFASYTLTLVPVYYALLWRHLRW